MSDLEGEARALADPQVLAVQPSMLEGVRSREIMIAVIQPRLIDGGSLPLESLPLFGRHGYQYTSPLRPLDMGYVSRLTGIDVDWDNTDIGPMDSATIRTRLYAFAAPLPAELVESLQLVALA